MSDRFQIPDLFRGNTTTECTSRGETQRTKKVITVIAIATALQPNTLKTLGLYYSNASLQVNDAESKQMALLLKKNYGLERLPDINQHDLAGCVGAILRLIEAGRRYLIEE